MKKEHEVKDGDGKVLDLGDRVSYCDHYGTHSATVVGLWVGHDDLKQIEVMCKAPYGHVLTLQATNVKRIDL